uniref:Centrosomal protein of 44 kDa n=1 Tax=Propithecus coquereli TaxID=379532 RepID=A0A2K6EZ20_PROCO
MATGDLKRSLRNLEQVLRLLNYPEEVDCVGSIVFIPVIEDRFYTFKPRLLRDQFNYKPILTKKQFIQCGFAEWKIQIVCDILNCVMKKHKELSSLEKTPSQQRKKSSSGKSEPCVNNEKISAEAVGVDITGSTVTEVSEAVAVSALQATEIKIPEVKVPEIKAEQQDIKVNPEITALQTMLAECQEKLKKLTRIEKRLECLEEKMKGKVLVNEKTWTNLLSRVTLLETEILLSKKSDEFIEYNEMSEDYSSSSDMDLLNAARPPTVRAVFCLSVLLCFVCDTTKECGLFQYDEKEGYIAPSPPSNLSRLLSRPTSCLSSWSFPRPLSGV